MGARGGSPARERALLEAARGEDGAAFGQLVEPYRAELHAHGYRMLGSVQDAEDALQDAMLGAWRGLAGFEGGSSLRASTSAAWTAPTTSWSATRSPPVPPDGGQPNSGYIEFGA